MTSSTDQFVDITKRSQDVLAESVRSWAETWQGLASQFTGHGRPQFPDSGVAVDRVFDFAEQVLGQQREFAKTVVGAGQHAVDTWTDQAAKVAEQVTDNAVHNAERAGDATAKATDSAAEKVRNTRSSASK
ncbi:hypothetical protein [Pseudonocardia endophytica]|uniref:Phasin protein n=1 Tax=Pseudonocardia endophytica TaxID=401976 RepID=A0A4R1HRR5_PSEEN|nr:hypothetical protein [Pseudonocardia endophytica]TCK24858.1 hypothetical protein EV378_0651 [Pseudonocardia endophytica]